MRFWLLISILVICAVSSVHSAYDPFEPDLIQLINTAVTEVRVTPQAQFNNLNTTPVINTDTDSDVFTSIASNGVICSPGTYMVDVALYHTSNNARTNPHVELTVNGVPTGIRGANGYVRVSNGTNESTTNVVDLVQLATASKIGFDTFELGAAGTVAAPVGQSSLRILRIADR